MLKTIQIISIPVTDQEKAKAFYRDQMGLTLITEAPMGENQKWIQLGLPGTETSITLVNWFKQMPAGSVQGLVIGTDNIQEDIDKMQANGIEMGKIDDTPWGKFSSFKDVDGNGWTLHQEN